MEGLSEHETRLHVRYRTEAARGSGRARTRPPEKIRVAGLARAWGKGPEWARAYLAGDDTTRRALTLDLDPRTR